MYPPLQWLWYCWSQVARDRVAVVRSVPQAGPKSAVFGAIATRAAGGRPPPGVQQQTRRRCRPLD